MSNLAGRLDPTPDDRRRAAAEQTRREHDLFTADPIQQALSDYLLARTASPSSRPRRGAAVANDVVPLPEDVVLFHAGFHKTGTTALQSAFASHRAEIATAGVRYPGSRRSHHRAALAVSQRTWGWAERGGRKTAGRYWRQIVAGAADPGRVFISSEAFALADDTTIDRILEQLPRERMHAIFTLRPFARLLSSSWQQYLKYGLSMPYEQWLREVFKHPPQCAPSPNFWHRNDHAVIMQRWAQRLGADRVTVVVLDESDRQLLYRSFESLLDLPSGILVPDADIAASNRSMTAAEAETLRLVNAGIAQRWGWPQYEKLVRRGAILRMVEGRAPGPDETALGTPQWAIESAQEVGRRTAERIAELGINVVGDVESLGTGMPPGQPPTDDLRLPVAAAAEAVLGAIAGAMAGSAQIPADDSAVNKLDLPAVQLMTTRDAADLLRDRVRTASRWRVKRFKRAMRGGRSAP